MLESFGARLRQRREEQALALVTIAQQTKIKLSLLEGLEQDDVSHWPSGIFRRAFVRAYAQAIGLNPDVVVREFLTVYPEPAEVVVTTPAVDLSGNGAATNSAPPTRLRHMMGSAIESLARLRRSPELPPAAPSPPPSRPDRSDPDFQAVAHLCTEFGRVENLTDAQPLLQQAARLLDAIGLIVWVWDELAGQLRPTLVHGYSDKVLAQLPTVRRDADNATAAAFRTARTCTIHGSDHDSGALVVPLLTPGGCAGVLALELQHGSEQTKSVRAVATIIAALLAQLIGGQAIKDSDLRQAAGSA
jgi:hypothetical protein